MTANQDPRAPVALAIHGGAGSSRPAQRRGLEEALAAGITTLCDGGQALDAVVAAVMVLEDDPCFNAGRGGARTADGGVELDAAVMEGTHQRAGGVACISKAKNPVAVARLLLEQDGPVLLAGAGADRFAVDNGAAVAPPGWFDSTPPASASPAHGTVGAVALDRFGNLAVATSTGGIEGQLSGRVGDTPVIGAGTFADTRCAVSATGDGEAFLRCGFAHLVAYRVGEGWSLRDACDAALEEVRGLGGSGGCVSVDAKGAVYLPFITEAMPRAWATSRDDLHVEL